MHLYTSGHKMLLGHRRLRPRFQERHLVYQPSTNYMDLLQETASIIADNLSQTNSRNVNYVKSVFEIASQKTDGSPLRGAFERAEAFVSLTEKEIQESLRSTLEVTEKLLAQGKKFQVTSYESAKEIADKAIVNAKHVVETTSDRIETLTDKVDGSISETLNKADRKVKAAATAE